MTTIKKKSYLWATLALFIISFTLHWYFGWLSFVEEQNSHHQDPLFSSYLNEMMRDTMENWQSEFLQLIWQVAGLSFLFFVGSPQSKEADDRKEEKIDYLIRQLTSHRGNQFIEEIEKKYPKK